MTVLDDLGPNACHSCGRPDVIQPDGSVPPHDVLGLASPCDAPPSIYPAEFPDPHHTPRFDRLTITLCGSLSRAAHDLRRVERALALAGHVVHAPCPPLPGEPASTPGQISLLTARHYEAIRRSDLVIAVIPDGRPGDATHQEMRYAKSVGKQVRWLSDVDALVGDVAAWLDGAEVPAC